MIEGKDIKRQVQDLILNGLDPLIAVQQVGTQSLEKVPEADRGMETKSTVISATTYYANEILPEEKQIGYREQDLIMLRAFPNAETQRHIVEQEGKNIFNS